MSGCSSKLSSLLFHPPLQMVSVPRQTSKIRAVPLLQNWQKWETGKNRVRVCKLRNKYRPSYCTACWLGWGGDATEVNNSLAKTASANMTSSFTSNHQKKGGKILVLFLGELWMCAENVKETQQRKLSLSEQTHTRGLNISDRWQNPKYRQYTGRWRVQLAEHGWFLWLL